VKSEWKIKVKRRGKMMALSGVRRQKSGPGAAAGRRSSDGNKLTGGSGKEGGARSETSGLKPFIGGPKGGGRREKHDDRLGVPRKKEV